MSSQPQKSAPKMCKSPKSCPPSKEKISTEYEYLSTNCTVIGSNNLHLVKKPQVVMSSSPAYSNPSPGYPPSSPYSSPASLKSPSPQNFKPPTPTQPTAPANFPVMQIINSQHILARPLQAAQPQNVIKLKPHLNILPKPSVSPQSSPKPSVSPHIVIPASQQTLMPTQPLLLNQMPMLAPGVQLILRPQTAKLPTHVQQAAPQGLILQPSGQPLLQLQPPRTTQQMVRVLTNGVQLAQPSQVVSTSTANATGHIQVNQTSHSQLTTNCSPKKKPTKKKKQKLDLANIMKLSGIGDDDDVQFESDSQSESEPNLQIDGDPRNTRPQCTTVSEAGKRIDNIQLSAVASPTPLVQLLNQSFQSGVNNTTYQSSQTAAQAGIPLNSFIAPNITINNGLVVQRNGGFKLALGEDGRLVLQHDPTLNQDLQSQILLQSIFGLNGLVLQPSIDQQVHSQTVQTIQQQSVQTIQQQTVQSQTIQTVQQQTVQPHLQAAIRQTLQPVQPQTVQQTVQQTIQHQTVQSQPMMHPHSQPMQIVQPQPIQTIQSHNIHQHTIQSQPVCTQIQQSQVQSIQSQIQGQIQSLLQSQPLQTIQSQPPPPAPPPSPSAAPPSQPVLKVQPFQKTSGLQPPVQTVHPQPNHHHHHHHHHSRSHSGENNHHQSSHHPPAAPPPASYVVNLTPDQLEQLKRNGQLTVNGQTIFMQRPGISKDGDRKSPKIRPVKKISKPLPVGNEHQQQSVGGAPIVKINEKTNHVKETKSSLVSALQSPLKIVPQQHNKPAVQPAAIVQPTKINKSVDPSPTPPPPSAATAATVNSEVEHLLGQLLEEPTNNHQPQQHHPRTHHQAQTQTASTQNRQVQTAPQQQPHQQQQPPPPQQRIQTIQLTPQQQQHLKSIQVQIQTLSARLTPGDTEMHAALKLLFAEQQKILASGKLLPPDKVIYQNNQLTIINPGSFGIGSGKNDDGVAKSTCTDSSITSGVQQSPKKIGVNTLTSSVISPTTSSAPAKVTTSMQPPPVPPVHHKFMPNFTKAQLLEQQLNTDQNGAMKPDIRTPFRDKADACKRLIRYHCYNQPVLSEKDLDKADEIFELTAKHFIDKFSRMVDKYKYLLLKESMKQVQTSELMMLDRLFLSEEQQSLMRLRQELESTGPPVDLIAQFAPPVTSAHQFEQQQQQQQSQPQQQQQQQQQQEEYDEWACIQRELGCLSNAANVSEVTTAHKRSASSDSRLETLKRFRVEKHGKKGVCSASGSGVQPPPIGGGGGNSIDEHVQSAIDSILNLQQNATNLDLDEAVSSILS